MAYYKYLNYMSGKSDLIIPTEKFDFSFNQVCFPEWGYNKEVYYPAKSVGQIIAVVQ